MKAVCKLPIIRQYQAMSNDEFITVTASSTWTNAKTMQDCPHEYVVRGKTADVETYFAMFQTIKEHGVLRDWGGTMYQYLHPGDGYYYWKMTDQLPDSMIINRAKEHSVRVFTGDAIGVVRKPVFTAERKKL